MLLRLTRLSVLLAAVAAAVGIFGPDAQRGLWVESAVALLGAAYLLWQGEAALRARRARRPVPVAAVRLLDAEQLVEAERLLGQAVIAGQTFESCLHRVGERLRGELGAHGLRIFIVDPVDGEPRLLEQVGGAAGVRLPVDLSVEADLPAVQALRARRCWSALPHALALPIFQGDAQPVAVIELARLEFEVDPAALERLLRAASEALGGHEACRGASSSPQAGADAVIGGRTLSPAVATQQPTAAGSPQESQARQPWSPPASCGLADHGACT